MSSKERKLLRDIRKILLSCKGKDNAINASEIAKRLKIKDNRTWIRTRTLIKKLVKEEGLPIAAHTYGGYYLIENDSELNEYLGSLERRILEIRDREKTVYDNFKKFYGIEEIFD
jgi:hypothetical protein